MAGVSDTPNRRSRRAAAATGAAPAAPAIEASAERAAIERDPAAAEVIPAPAAPVLPAAELPDDAAVLPEPTLTAEPGAPVPIVTASPILAVEPSALDVVQAEAADARIEAGTATEADRDQARIAAAGQPTIAIEGSVTALMTAINDASARIDEMVFDDRRPGDRRAGHELLFGDRQMVNGWPLLTFEEIVQGLEQLRQRDPIAMDSIRTRFFQPASDEFTGTLDQTSTVTIVEVVGPAQGRRRAGMSFGPQPRRFLASDLRADEIEALRSDSLLAVGLTEVERAAWDTAAADTMPAPGY